MKKVAVLFLSIILSFSLLFSSIAYAANDANKDFTDVEPSDWFYEDVQRLAGMGAIAGFNDGTFRPENAITRAEFTKILISALEYQTVSGNYFSDTKNHWAADSISTAVYNGIIVESEYDGGFQPEKPINRLEMAKMMLRALKISPVDGESPFVDIDNGYTTSAYNEYLIMGSVSGGKRYFNPYDNASRSEASAIVVRALDYKADPAGYKTRKEKEIKNAGDTDSAANTGNGNGSSDIRFKNVTSLPDVVSVNTPDDFAGKIMTAVYLKKDSITLKINNYNDKDYNFEDIDKYINRVRSENSDEKGFATGYRADISIKNNIYAEVRLEFIYSDSSNSNGNSLGIPDDSDFPVSIEDYISEKYKDKTVIKSDKEWYSLIRTALENCQDKIEYDPVNSIDVGDIIDIVLEQNPEIGYIDSYVKCGDGTIKFDYNFQKDKLTAMKKKTQEKAKKIIAQIIKPSMNDIEKAKAIHDYIIKNAKYDYANYKKNNIPPESYTAYGVLVNGTGVCEGYAAAFNMLAKMAGLKSMGVTGYARGPHAWNMVKLNGKARHIDVTWDDPVPDRGSQVRYDYFNITDKQIAKDHNWDKEMFAEKYLDY